MTGFISLRMIPVQRTSLNLVKGYPCDVHQLSNILRDDTGALFIRKWNELQEHSAARKFLKIYQSIIYLTWGILISNRLLILTSKNAFMNTHSSIFLGDCFELIIFQVLGDYFELIIFHKHLLSDITKMYILKLRSPQIRPK